MLPAATVNVVDSELAVVSPAPSVQVYFRKYAPAGKKPPVDPPPVTFTVGAVVGFAIAGLAAIRLLSSTATPPV
jgi:hypothetical protein